MDALTFPTPWVSVPCLPYEELKAAIVDDLQAQDYTVEDPLTLDDFPETTIARNAFHNLACFREALTSPFNTPDATMPRLTWIRYIYETLACIHEGLHNAQLASPNGSFPDAFSDLSKDEQVSLIDIRDVLDWINDFFTPKNTAGVVRTLCLACVRSTGAELSDTHKSLAHSMTITSSLD